MSHHNVVESVATNPVTAYSGSAATIISFFANWSGVITGVVGVLTIAVLITQFIKNLLDIKRYEKRDE